MTEEQTFLQYERMLHRIAWSFHRTTGIEQEEFFSEACVGFLHAIRTHNPSRSTLSTWIWICVTTHLKAFLTKQKQEKASELCELFADPRDDISAQENWEEVLTTINSEAKEVVQIILEAPGEFFDAGAKFARGILFRKLRRMGWSWATIWDSFREIKTALK